MQKKLYTLLLLCFFSSQLFSQTQLNTFNYWFDNDYANNISLPLTTVDTNINTLINTSSLSDGLHSIKSRVKDVNGLWSSVVNESFIKQNGAISNIVSYRYWFNSDFANAIDSVLSIPQQFVNLNPTNLIISTISLPPNSNPDTLNVQFKSSSGIWSSVITNTFTKCALGVNIGLHLDTLLQNFNSQSNEVMQGARIHKYYWLRNATNTNAANINVDFEVTNNTGFIDTLTFGSNSNGLVDMYIDLEGADTTTHNDDYLSIGNYNIKPIQFDLGTCKVLYSNLPNYLITPLNITSYQPVESSFGFFISGSKGFPLLAMPKKGGSKKLGLDMSVGAGFDLDIKETYPNYVMDVNLNSKGSIDFDAKVDEENKGLQFTAGIGDASLKVGGALKLSDVTVSNPPSLGDFILFSKILAENVSKLATLNVASNLFSRALNAYLLYTQKTFPISKLEASLSIKAEANIAPSFEIGLADNKAKNSNGTDPYSFKIKTFNVGGIIGLGFKSSFDLDALGNIETSKYKYSMMHGWDFTPLDLRTGNYIDFSGSTNHESTFEVANKINRNTLQREGNISLTSDMGTTLSIGGISFDLNKSVETEYTFGLQLINQFIANTNNGLLNNRLANCMTGNTLSNLSLYFDTDNYSANSSVKEVGNLFDYTKTIYNPNWKSPLFKTDITRNYLYSTKFELTGINDLVKDICDKAADMADFEANCGVKWNRSYPFISSIYSKEADSNLTFINYANSIQYVNEPIQNEVNDFWNLLKNEINGLVTDIKAAVYDPIVGFMHKSQQTISTSYTEIINNTRSVTGLRQAHQHKKTRNVVFTDFSTLKMAIHGDTSFTVGTSINYINYFPGGEVFNSILGSSDTCVIISDIVFLEATNNGVQIDTAQNGDFELIANIGIDDINYFGYDTLSSYNLVYRSFSDTLWQNLGAFTYGATKTISTKKLGSYAICKILQHDSIPPNINITLPTSFSNSNFIRANLTDNMSGVDWTSIKVIINGQLYNFERDGLTNDIIIPCDSVIPNLLSDNLIAVEAQDLVGNYRYTITNFITAIKDKNLVQKSVSIYPNPTFDFLYIKPSAISSNVIKAKVYSLDGSLILESELLKSNSQDYVINIKSLISGVYILELNIDNELHKYKILKK